MHLSEQVLDGQGNQRELDHSGRYLRVKHHCSTLTLSCQDQWAMVFVKAPLCK